MQYNLAAEKRAEKGEKTRLTGRLPGVVYGGTQETQSLQVSLEDFTKLYKAAKSSLIDLALNGAGKETTLIQDVTFHPVSGRITHFDLRRVDMNKPITATIELKFMGEAPVVKALGGTLVVSISSIEVECLPKDLVTLIEVDLSSLNSFEDTLKVKDLNLPAGMKLVTLSDDDVVAKGVAALTEDELKALEDKGKTQADLSAIESAKKKKEKEDADTAADAAGAKKVEGKKPAEKK